MGAAPKEMSGTASGINNAVARTAGVLAVAIIGALAIGIFTSNLEARAASLDIPAGSMDALRAQAAQFGAAQPPADLSAEQPPPSPTRSSWRSWIPSASSPGLRPP
ncbi:MAG: hypothetical protein U0521_17110 [Anaerolineae bacterium]